MHSLYAIAETAQIIFHMKRPEEDGLYQIVLYPILLVLVKVEARYKKIHTARMQISRLFLTRSNRSGKKAYMRKRLKESMKESEFWVTKQICAPNI